MLTGRLPERTNGRLAPPSSFRPDLNWAWDELILKSLAVQPSARFASAGQMRRMFEEVYADWARESRSGCHFTEAPCRPEKPLLPRREPKRIAYKDARGSLGLNQLLHPERYHEQGLEVVDASHVRDLDTGILWQRRGSEYTLDWNQAADYVASLNRQRCLGRNTWRLPTMAELLTILRPPTIDRDFCLPQAFTGTIHWLWSSDWCSKKQAWMVDIIECFAEKLDKDGAASVCAVSSS